MKHRAASPPANFLDRLVSYVSPMRGLRRMQARAGMAALGGVVEQVRRVSASREGTMANFDPRREHRYGEGRSSDLIMRRAEDLVASDGHAASCVDSLALNVAGPGLRPQSYPDVVALGISDEAATTFAESAERVWKAWCAEADAAETDHFDDIQYQLVWSLFTCGEFLCLLPWMEEPSRAFGLAVQALHPARLRTPADMVSDASIRGGVKLGPCNRPEGYYIAEPMDGHLLAGLTSSDFRYIPRKAGHRWLVLHRRHGKRPETIRGTTILSPAMKMFRDLGDYVDYELVGALIAASFTVFLETAPDQLGTGFKKKDGTLVTSGYPEEIEPGLLITGQAGHKPHILTSNRPAPQFDAFYTRVLRAVAASTGQPYELVAKDFSRTNYSSARAALLEVWKLHTLYQDWFIRGFLHIVWRMVLEEAFLRGMLAVPAGAPGFYNAADAWCAAVWTRPPRGQIDPVKEREAEDLALDSVTETRTAICHARGLDFEAVARTRARENNILARLGLEPVRREPKPKAPAVEGQAATPNPEEETA